MIIGKILNNNVVISTNDAGQEVIYMGRGIAFKKKVGDPVDEVLIKKGTAQLQPFLMHQSCFLCCPMRRSFIAVPNVP